VWLNEKPSGKRSMKSVLNERMCVGLLVGCEVKDTFCHSKRVNDFSLMNIEALKKFHNQVRGEKFTQ
jgi:adenine C2-methylase RlmN of 23S rRNA A2503 and tRNA A37